MFIARLPLGIKNCKIFDFSYFSTFNYHIHALFLLTPRHCTNVLYVHKQIDTYVNMLSLSELFAQQFMARA